MSTQNSLGRLDGLKRGLSMFLMTLAGLLFFAGTGHAQGTVSGTVTDESGEPLIGASVFVEGNSAVGAITDLDGKYMLSLPSDAKALVFSFIGMGDLVEPLNGRSVVNVQMKAVYTALEATVVTAMGITKSEKSLSYNVQEMPLAHRAPTPSSRNSRNRTPPAAPTPPSATAGGGVAA